MSLTEHDKKILREAYNIIRDKKRWTQGAFAKNEAGFAVGISIYNAHAFCLVGAIMRVTGLYSFYGSSLAKRLTNAIVPKSYTGCQLGEYNDLVMHATLMRRIRQALKD